MKKMSCARLSVSVPPDMAEWLRKTANEERCSISRKIQTVVLREMRLEGAALSERQAAALDRQEGWLQRRAPKETAPRQRMAADGPIVYPQRGKKK